MMPPCPQRGHLSDGAMPDHYVWSHVDGTSTLSLGAVAPAEILSNTTAWLLRTDPNLARDVEWATDRVLACRLRENAGREI